MNTAPLLGSDDAKSRPMQQVKSRLYRPELCCFTPFCLPGWASAGYGRGSGESPDWSGRMGGREYSGFNTFLFPSCPVLSNVALRES